MRHAILIRTVLANSSGEPSFFLKHVKRSNPVSLPADGGSGLTITYPLGRLTESARQLRTTANHALTAHDQAWQAVQAYVSSYPEFLQPSLSKLLDTYQQRLRSTYTLYLSFADWLDYAHDQMQHTDHAIGGSFDQFLNQQKG
jgi:hypothetical protein